MPWLALAGYMGAGKTTAGRRVADALGLAFVDSDDEIAAAAGMDIPAIFSDKGELWFRRTEERVLREILGGEPGVLALGGGALGSERTRGLLARTARVVWLRVDPEVAWERVAGPGRPLATDRDRFVRRHAAREPVYREAADHVVEADAPASDVAAAVVAWAAPRLGAGTAG